MANVTYSSLAEMDLIEIWQYIGQDRAENADKFVDSHFQRKKPIDE